MTIKRLSGPYRNHIRLHLSRTGPHLGYTGPYRIENIFNHKNIHTAMAALHTANNDHNHNDLNHDRNCDLQPARTFQRQNLGFCRHKGDGILSRSTFGQHKITKRKGNTKYSYICAKQQQRYLGGLTNST
ncbi:hypothetical protein Lal_00032456 [Lupinus albus]|nr:hypothetical protein Lal_00032456 [Lupinus albus]